MKAHRSHPAKVISNVIHCLLEQLSTVCDMHAIAARTLPHARALKHRSKTAHADNTHTQEKTEVIVTSVADRGTERNTE
jgi:hypothetical protein